MANAGRKKRFTNDQVIAALEKTHGIQALAASELGCGRTTISRYIQENPEIQEAITKIQEGILDKAEKALLEAIDNGQLGAIIYYLKTKGKRRGYTEKLEAEVTGAGGGPLQVATWSDLIKEVFGDAPGDDATASQSTVREGLH